MGQPLTAPRLVDGQQQLDIGLVASPEPVATNSQCPSSAGAAQLGEAAKLKLLVSELQQQLQDSTAKEKQLMEQLSRASTGSGGSSASGSSGEPRAGSEDSGRCAAGAAPEAAMTGEGAPEDEDKQGGAGAGLESRSAAAAAAGATDEGEEDEDEDGADNHEAADEAAALASLWDAISQPMEADGGKCEEANGYARKEGDGDKREEADGDKREEGTCEKHHEEGGDHIEEEDGKVAADDDLDGEELRDVNLAQAELQAWREHPDAQLQEPHAMPAPGSQCPPTFVPPAPPSPDAQLQEPHAMPTPGSQCPPTFIPPAPPSNHQVPQESQPPTVEFPPGSLSDLPPASPLRSPPTAQLPEAAASLQSMFQEMLAAAVKQLREEQRQAFDQLATSLRTTLVSSQGGLCSSPGVAGLVPPPSPVTTGCPDNTDKPGVMSTGAFVDDAAMDAAEDATRAPMSPQDIHNAYMRLFKKATAKKRQGSSVAQQWAIQERRKAIFEQWVQSGEDMDALEAWATRIVQKKAQISDKYIFLTEAQMKKAPHNFSQAKIDSIKAACVKAGMWRRCPYNPKDANEFQYWTLIETPTPRVVSFRTSISARVLFADFTRPHVIS